MADLAKKSFLERIVKYRLHIILIFLGVFSCVAGMSYYLNGRTYKSGVEFYFFKSSFDDFKTDNTILLTKEEIEIIKSITSSEQLFLSVVTSKNLIKYYNKKFAYEANEILRNATSITIDDKSKISIFVDDRDNYFAFRIANDMMKQINELYNMHLETFKKNQRLKCDQQINHFMAEKQNIIKTCSKYPSSLLDFKFSEDSVKGPDYLKRLNNYSKQTGIKVGDVISILNLFHRWDKVEEQIYLYTDQKQQIQNSLFMLNRNHIFITNKQIRFRRTVGLYYHVVLGLKIGLLSAIAFIVSMIFYNSYQQEIRMVFKPMRESE